MDPVNAPRGSGLADSVPVIQFVRSPAACARAQHFSCEPSLADARPRRRSRHPSSCPPRSARDGWRPVRCRAPSADRRSLSSPPPRPCAPPLVWTVLRAKHRALPMPRPVIDDAISRAASSVCRCRARTSKYDRAMYLASSEGTARTTICAPSPSIMVNSRRAATSVSATRNSPASTPERTMSAMQLQPLGGQRVGLGRQCGVAPAQAPRRRATGRWRPRWSRRADSPSARPSWRSACQR